MSTTDNKSSFTCPGCGTEIMPNRVLYHNGNRVCWPCYRDLEAGRASLPWNPPTHTYPPMYYPRPPTPRPYPTYPIIWC